MCQTQAKFWGLRRWVIQSLLQEARGPSWGNRLADTQQLCNVVSASTGVWVQHRGSRRGSAGRGEEGCHAQLASLRWHHGATWKEECSKWIFTLTCRLFSRDLCLPWSPSPASLSPPPTQYTFPTPSYLICLSTELSSWWRSRLKSCSWAV